MINWSQLAQAIWIMVLKYLELHQQMDFTKFMDQVQLTIEYISKMI